MITATVSGLIYRCTIISLLGVCLTLPDFSIGQSAPSDLVVTVQSGLDRVTVNQLVTWRVTVTNLGPSMATDVLATNRLPPAANLFAVSVQTGTVITNGSQLVFSVGNLLSGTGFEAEVTLFKTTIGEITNSVWAASSSLDTNPANNIATSSVSVMSGTFLAGGQMLFSRAGHTATLLTNGLVLITGGYNSNGILRSAELFNPATGLSSLVGDMTIPRFNHTATLLPNGRVLIVGYSFGDPTQIITDLYDPVSNTLSSTGNLNVPRTQHATSLLPDGRVLVTGGIPVNSSSAETYNHLTGTWSALPVMSMAAESHTSTVLTNGEVLVMGGPYSYPVPAQLFRPMSNAFALSAVSTQSRQLHTATLLADGRVLIAGGDSAASYTPVFARAEFFTSSSGQFSDAGRMVEARKGHTASLLTNGTVLLTGGIQYHDSRTAEVFDPMTTNFSATVRMLAPRLRHTATSLSDGRVLILGGEATSYYSGSYQKSMNRDGFIFSHHYLSKMPQQMKIHQQPWHFL
jgi:uncharacterized repeat protein (TIGR01451 family)